MFVAWAGAILMVASSFVYSVVMLSLSRLKRTTLPPAPSGRRALTAGTASDEDFVVFLIPCLNEGRVIGASMERLQALPQDNWCVMVIDDGSDDDTASIVESFSDDPRINLMRRVAPNARQGKGEALNAAVELISGGHLIGDRDPARVIVAILDADGRLERQTIDEVLPYFADEKVGGVQIGVRINNRHSSVLARMQDFEFVSFTDVFQRGRRLIGSVGLGGNGQFMRLSALHELGARPWSKSLTEDLDLGVRLIALGWRNEFCPTAAVHQQGVTELGRLIRQRARWFQGHLQSWVLIPTVFREVRGRARMDLLYHLTSPVLLLLASLLSLSFVLGLINSLLLGINGHNPFTPWLLSTYVLSVLPAMMLAFIYRQHEVQKGFTWFKTVVVAHQYVAYSLMWYAAGWRAVVRTLRRETGWAKTARNIETTDTVKGPDELPSPGPAVTA